jgi:hypothetical protein
MLRSKVNQSPDVIKKLLKSKVKPTEIKVGKFKKLRKGVEKNRSLIFRN